MAGRTLTAEDAAIQAAAAAALQAQAATSPEAGFSAFLRIAQGSPSFMGNLRTGFPGVFNAPAPVPTVNSTAARPREGKTIEEKNYRRVEKYTGAPGTWSEWSFDFITTTQGINLPVGRILEAMNKASESTVTEEAVNRVAGITDAIKAEYGAELFTVLNSLTGGDAAGVVRGVIAKIGRRCGFAAFYALNCRFNPKTPARMLQYLLIVTHPPPIKDARLIPKGIEDWEQKRTL